MSLNPPRLGAALVVGAMLSQPFAPPVPPRDKTPKERLKQTSGKTPRTHRRKPRVSSPASHHYPRFAKRERNRRLKSRA